MLDIKAESHRRIEAICMEFIRRAEGSQYFTKNRDFIFVHPELLSEETDAFLEQHSVDPHSSPVAYAFARMQILLKRCKEIGIDGAFEEEKLKELTRLLLGDGAFGDREDFVEEHPELLSPATDRVLADSAARQKSDGARKIFTSLRQLLRRCNEIGISDAFAEYRSGIPQYSADTRELVTLVQQFVAATDNSERRKILTEHPELLSVQAEELMRRTDDPRVAQKFAPVLELLKRCREKGVEEAFRSSPEIVREAEEYAITIVEDVQKFLFADSPREKKEIVEKNPHLLEPPAEQILEEFATGLDDVAQDWVRKHRRLLTACREYGTDIAFATYSSSLDQKTANLQDNQASGLQQVADLTHRVKTQPELLPLLIETCQSQLASLSRDVNVQEFVTLKMALGQALSHLPPDASDSPWQRAIQQFDEALESCSPTEQPVIFANLNMEAARVLAVLPHGDRYSNQLRAQQHNFRALEAWKAEGMTDQIVGTMLNISHLFSDYISGDDEVNTEAAVAYSKEALYILNQAGKDTGIALLPLGGALFSRKKGKREDNVREAIKYFEAALNRYSEGPASVLCLLNLASALLRINPDQTTALKAVHYLTEALQRASETEEPVTFAAIQRALAEAYRQLGDSSYHAAIITCYKNSIRVLNLRNDPHGLLNSLLSLGRYYGHCGDWMSASEICLQALEVSDNIYKQGIARASKQESIDDHAELFSLACYALTKRGDITQALLILDHGKARLLGENLKLHAPRPKNVSDSVWAEYLMASYLMRQTEWEESHGVADYKQFGATTSSRIEQFATAVAHIREIDASFLELSTLDILGEHVLDSKTAVITFCCTEYGSLSFTVSQGRPYKVSCVDIPSFKRRDLIDLVTAEPDDSGFATKGWLGTLGPYLKDRTFKSLSQWLGQMPITLQQLGLRLFEPVLTGLPTGIEKLFIVPSHEMYVLPLQAVLVESRSNDVLIDRFDISFAPSLDFLAHSCLHSYGRGRLSLVAAINPQDDDALTFAKYEASAIARAFEKPSIFYGEAARRETVARELSSANVAHFACHGLFRWDTPRKSGLILADGELIVDELLLGEITLDEERDGDNRKFLCLPLDLSNLRLVTLSACESGVSNVLRGSPAEVLALSSGFLLAGVPSVVSSLWAVNDLSTSLFMERMYLELAAESSVPKAIRAAAKWIRHVTASELASLCSSKMADDYFMSVLPTAIRSRMWRQFASMDATKRPYEHPYYWAAFTANGV